jgi:hypothetical protein
MTDEKENRYISFFQSVMTVGILSVGKDEKEASERAFKKLSDKEGVNHCYFDQTGFELEKVESWNPEFGSESLGELNGELILNVKLSPETKAVIATRLQKSVENLTDSDYAGFLKDSFQASLEQISNPLA